jgi:enediyne biosynthesis protein E4
MFATDMKPNLGDMSEVAMWSPLIDRPFNKLQRSDLQRAENVLQLQTGPGMFANKGYVRGLDATGWSWSAQFGDLDADGHEDLYIVNGMIDHELLPYLPGDEIVERNVTFRGSGGARFGRDPKWGLDSTASGRSMALADLNADGRLDVVINNLEGPAEVFENRHCGGATLSVDLMWLGVDNRSALGSIVSIETDVGAQHRLVAGSSGYLTWLPSEVHFGLGSAVPVAVRVTWPDGATSTVPMTSQGSASGGSRPHLKITIQRPAEKQ